MNAEQGLAAMREGIERARAGGFEPREARSVITPEELAHYQAEGKPEVTGNRVRIPMRVTGPALMVFECQPVDVERFERFAQAIVDGRAKLGSLLPYITGQPQTVDVYGVGRWWE